MSPARRRRRLLIVLLVLDSLLALAAVGFAEREPLVSLMLLAPFLPLVAATLFVLEREENAP